MGGMHMGRVNDGTVAEPLRCAGGSMPLGHICPSCGKIVDAIEHASAGCGHGARTAADHEPDPHPWKPPTFPTLVGQGSCNICGTGQRHAIHPQVTRPVGELLAVHLDELSYPEIESLLAALAAEYNRRADADAIGALSGLTTFEHDNGDGTVDVGIMRDRTGG